MDNHQEHRPQESADRGPVDPPKPGEELMRTEAPSPPKPAVARVQGDRPFRDTDLAVAWDQPVQVTLRYKYAIPQGKNEQAIEGPKKVTLTFRRACARAHQMEEADTILERAKALRDELQHRRAEWNRNPGVGKTPDLRKPSPASA